MATQLFDQAALQLENQTDLDRLEARGTLRLAIKAAGLDAENLTLAQLSVVFEKVMPNELQIRGIEAPTTTCSSIMDEIMRTADADETPSAKSSDEIFRRLGGK